MLTVCASRPGKPSAREIATRLEPAPQKLRDCKRRFKAVSYSGSARPRSGSFPALEQRYSLALNAVKHCNSFRPDRHREPHCAGNPVTEPVIRWRESLHRLVRQSHPRYLGHSSRLHRKIHSYYCGYLCSHFSDDHPAILGCYLHCTNEILSRQIEHGFDAGRSKL